ncbi:MAG: hypothetical protein IJW16_03595 [Clostridia bacterium]|nr:hypothetical protein [Clostridia bacterium]
MNGIRSLCTFLALLLALSLISCLPTAPSSKSGKTDTSVSDTDEPTAVTTTPDSPLSTEPTTEDVTTDAPTTVTTTDDWEPPAPSEPSLDDYPDVENYLTVFEENAFDSPVSMYVCVASTLAYEYPTGNLNAMSTTYTMGKRVTVLSIATFDSVQWAQLSMERENGMPYGLAYVEASALASEAAFDNTDLDAITSTFSFTPLDTPRKMAVSTAIGMTFLPVYTMPIANEAYATGLVGGGHHVDVYADGTGAYEGWVLFYYADHATEHGYYFMRAEHLILRNLG